MKNQKFEVFRGGHLFERNPFRSDIRDFRQYQTDFEKEMVQKGLASEKLFFKMASELLTKKCLPPAITRIRHASRIQDERQYADFLMDITDGCQTKAVRIQIKSSIYGAHEFEAEHPNSRVYVIVMDENMTIGGVASALEDICRIELQRMYRRIRFNQLACS
ncbi:MAG: hypothetical protein NTZ38_02435 [Candidatus Taylorbacteria bacterium]|nr:hypothetical protein [Candidatus Taylorbacteria bacterium]